MKIDAEAFQDRRISDYLYRHAADTPDKEAVCDERKTLSYSELLERVEACAKALIAFGIKKGDRVATLSPPQTDYLIVLLATTLIGGIWVGLNPRHTRDELEHVISDSEPSLIFARTRIGDRPYFEDLRHLQDRIQSVQRVVVLDGDFVYPSATSYAAFVAHQSDVDDDQLAVTRGEVVSVDGAVLIYTSGTTGKPKGALLHHYGAIRHCHLQISLRSPGAVRQINPYPINHIAGVIGSSIYCLVAGGTTYYLEKFDPGTVLETIEEKRITVWGGVPVMIQSVLDHPDFSRTDLSSVRNVSYNGGAASKDLLKRVASEICPSITTTYALTEAAGIATAIAPTDDIELLTESVGKPVGDCEFRLVDEFGQEVERGSQGEIQVRGPFIMKGYWRQSEATKQAIDEEGWLHTKDVAFERDDGNIVLVGRLTDMYKSGGYNIYPREIEQVLESHPSVGTACVVGAPDPTYGEVGCAFLALIPGKSADEESLRECCRQSLANYKIPKYFVMDREWPLLPNNKPDRRRLKELASKTIHLRPTED